MAEPIGEPGWWRLTPQGWQHVPDHEAEAEVADGGGWDLVHVEVQPAAEEIPLF